MDEPMGRACHALAAEGRVWLVDPVDEPAAMAAAATLGEPAGVLQLLDRHNRDCAAIATRFGVPRVVNPDALAAPPFELVPVIRWPAWRETALWWPAEGVLVVPEAVGTAPAFAIGPGPVGVHPMIRLVPPERCAGSPHGTSWSATARPCMDRRPRARCGRRSRARVASARARERARVATSRGWRSSCRR
jgi:hypothetical protein